MLDGRGRRSAGGAPAASMCNPAAAQQPCRAPSSLGLQAYEGLQTAQKLRQEYLFIPAKVGCACLVVAEGTLPGEPWERLGSMALCAAGGTHPEAALFALVCAAPRPQVKEVCLATGQTIRHVLFLPLGCILDLSVSICTVSHAAGEGGVPGSPAGPARGAQVPLRNHLHRHLQGVGWVCGGAAACVPSRWLRAAAVAVACRQGLGGPAGACTGAGFCGGPWRAAASCSPSRSARTQLAQLFPAQTALMLRCLLCPPRRAAICCRCY